MKKAVGYFTVTEIILWSVSVILIILSFLVFDRVNYLTLAASIVGVTSLIFCAKGNPAGQALMIVFSIMYGIISFAFSYYGEMITYLGMTMPMAIVSMISWIRNPYNGNKSEVHINRISRREIIFAVMLTAAVTVLFYFILKLLGTANLIPSTVSVTTSFFCGVSHIPKKPLVCSCLCRKRYGTNNFVDIGSFEKYRLYFCCGMLCSISCKRSLRIYKLEENGAEAE